jgi:hypothetical protein
MDIPPGPTPTQYDLARWLYTKIESLDPPKNKDDALAIMHEVLQIVRPPSSKG